jgi:hypothetical protein
MEYLIKQAIGSRPGRRLLDDIPGKKFESGGA